MKYPVQIRWFDENNNEYAGGAEDYVSAVSCALNFSPVNSAWVRIKLRNKILFRGTIEQLKASYGHLATE